MSRTPRPDELITRRRAREAWAKLAELNRPRVGSRHVLAGDGGLTVDLAGTTLTLARVSATGRPVVLANPTRRALGMGQALDAPPMGEGAPQVWRVPPLGCPPAYSLTRHIARQYGSNTPSSPGAGPFSVDALVSLFEADGIALGPAPARNLFITNATDLRVYMIHGSDNIIECICGDGTLGGNGSGHIGEASAGFGVANCYHAGGPDQSGGTISSGYPDDTGMDGLISRMNVAASPAPSPDGLVVHFIAQTDASIGAFSIAKVAPASFNLQVIVDVAPSAIRISLPGYSGDGGPAGQSGWNYTRTANAYQDMACHPITGDLYAYDHGNGVVRKIDYPVAASSTISSVLGGPNLSGGLASYFCFSPAGAMYFWNGLGEIVRWDGAAQTVVAGSQVADPVMTARGAAFDGCVDAGAYIAPSGMTAAAGEVLYVLLADGIVRIDTLNHQARSLVRQADVAADSNGDAATKPASGAHIGIAGTGIGLGIDDARNISYITHPFLTSPTRLFPIVARAEP